MKSVEYVIQNTSYKHTITQKQPHSSFPKQVFIGQFTESAVVTIPKKNRPKSPEKEKEKKKDKYFCTLYKVLMLISPPSSKTSVRTTLGLGLMKSPPKISSDGCMKGGDVTRPGVTADEQKS